MDKLSIILGVIIMVIAIGVAMILAIRIIIVRKFIPTKAFILEFGKKEVHSEGFTRQYNLVAKYEYLVGDTKYVGRNINIMDVGKGQFPNYDDSLFRKLKVAQENSEAIKIWINPSNPGDSIITKKIYWEKFIVLFVLAIVGMAMITYW